MTSACCSSPSPSSSWIAFICWRRKNSRWPLSISGLDLRLDLGAELDHLELAGEDLREVAEPGDDVDLLEQLLLLLGRDPQRAGDQVAEGRRFVDVGDRQLQLFRQVGDLLDDLREGALDVAGQRLQLGAVGRLVGQLGDPGDEVGLLGDVRAESHPLGPLDEDPDRPVGDFDHPGDDAGDADVVEVGGARLVVLGIARGDHHQHPVGAEDVVDQLDRAFLADRQRGQRLREGDRLAQRQDRERVGQRLRWRGSRPRRRAATRRLRGPGVPSISLTPPDRDAPGGLGGVAQRQLDPQDAVLVGRLGAVGVDVGLELDDAAERARRDLDLLVDAALGLLDRPLADDRQGRPLTSIPTSSRSTPARSTLTIARCGSPQ